MREVWLSPDQGQRQPTSVQVAVGLNHRVLIRIGRGQWRTLSNDRAIQLSELLAQAAKEARED